MAPHKKQPPKIRRGDRTGSDESETLRPSEKTAAFLEGVAFCSFYILAVGVALFYSWETKSNFIMPKAWIFEPATAFIALMWGASMFLKRRVEIAPSKIYLPAAVFLAICALSIVKSRVPYEGEKALRFLIFAAFGGFLTISLVTSRFRLRAILWGMIFISCVEAVWGIAQKRGFDPIFHLTSDSVGTLGNSNYLGALLGLTLPVLVAFGIAEYLRENHPKRKIFIAIVALGALAIITVGLAITECQGAYLSSIVAVSAIIAAWLVKSPKGRRGLIITALAAIPAVVISAAVVASLLLGKAPVKRFAHLGERAVGGRLLMWEVSMNMVHEHPLLGIGIGNFQRNYLDYLSAALKQKDMLAIRNIIQNEEKPHNAYVQFWSETGSLGLAAFLTLLGVFFWGRIRAFLKIEDRTDMWTHVGVTAGFLGFCALLFVSSLLVIAPFREYFWIFMGLAIAWERVIGAPEKPEFVVEFGDEADWRKWAVLVVCVFLPFVWLIYAISNSARNWKADVLWQSGISSSHVNNVADSIGIYDQAIALIPRDMKLLFYRGSAVIRLSETQTDHEKRVELLNEGIDDLLRAREGYADVNLDSNIAKAYSDLGKYDEAVEYYKTAAETGLKIETAYANLGIAYILAGKYDEAIKSLETALVAKPDSVRARFNLGVALLKNHRASEAEKVFADLAGAVQNNPEIFINLGSALAEQNKATEAIDSFNRAISIEPNNTRARNLFAESLWRIGKKQDALNQWRKVLEIDPKNRIASENIEKRGFDGADPELNDLP